jgi:hypothetical protein
MDTQKVTYSNSIFKDLDRTLLFFDSVAHNSESLHKDLLNFRLKISKDPIDYETNSQIIGYQDSLLEKLIKDGYIHSINTPYYRHIGITIEGKLFLAKTLSPFKNQPYRYKNFRNALDISWKITKLIAVAIYSLLIAWIAYKEMIKR